jgi:hypothetical protein
VLFGAVGAVAAFATNDTKTITPIFVIGAIDSVTGDYVEDNTAIYTKDMFNCGALRVEPDFEFRGTYDIFYYNSDGFLVASVTDKTGIYVMNELNTVGEYARIVIHPEEPDDYDDNKGKDPFEIKWYDVAKYSSEITIKVGKNGFEYRDFINLYDENNAIYGKSYFAGTGEITGDLFAIAKDKVCEKIAVHEDYKSLELSFRFKVPPQGYFAMVFFDENGTLLKSYTNDLSSFSNGVYKFKCAIPEGATHVGVSVPSDATVYLYGITK